LYYKEAIERSQLKYKDSHKKIEKYQFSVLTFLKEGCIINRVEKPQQKEVSQ